MIIKDTPKKKKKNIFNNFLKAYFVFSFLLIIFFITIFFNSGIWINNKNEILHKIYVNGYNHHINIFKITFKGFKSLFYDYEEINIDLPLENLIVLEKNRTEIINNSKDGMRARNQEFSEVKGFLTYENTKVPIRLRLKGVRITHFQEKDKASYKIKVLGGERIKGVRKFSFIKPRARNYIHEWLLHELAGEVGLIKLKYDFAYLKINGESQGLYVFEEGFDKDLIERNQKRNGPIFSLDEEFNVHTYESRFEMYNKNYWNRDENIQLSNYAKNKLQGFFDNRFSLEDTFDIKKWALLFAISDLTYTRHGLATSNVKFYYNPISGLFEPIAYDGHRTNANYNKNIKFFDDLNIYEFSKKYFDLSEEEKYQSYYEKTLNSFFFDKNENLNLNSYSEYIGAIKKITDTKFLSNFFENRKKVINKINSAIYSDYFLIDNVTYGKYGPGLYYFSQKDLFYRAEVLKQKISKELNKISAIETLDQIIIESEYSPNNTSFIAVDLLCKKFENNEKKDFIYKISTQQSSGSKIEIKKNDPSLKNSKCYHVKFEDKFSDEVYLKKINYNLPILFNESQIKNKYLNYFHKKNNILLLKDKIVEINEDIIIPENFIIKIKPGENIKILNNAFIISNSPWEVGDKNGVVSIGGSKDNFGGGLVIKNTKKLSKFHNTEFKYLSGVKNRFLYHEGSNSINLLLTKYSENKKNNYLYEEIPLENYIKTFSNKYNYTGAINFYETSIVFQNCKFIRIDSEDALNIISSQFLIEDSKFKENSSDSIDIDFGNGIIKNSNFEFVGNDAVDLSGSKVYIENLFFLNVGDKLISAGERTEVNIKKIEGKNSYIGIASKDGSISVAENIKLINVKIPFASYQKKKSYKHGILKINNPINLENYITKNLKDKKSEIYLNEKKIKNSNKQVINIVYEKKLNLIYD